MYKLVEGFHLKRNDRTSEIRSVGRSPNITQVQIGGTFNVWD